MMRIAAALIFIMMAASACGFKPLYGGADGSAMGVVPDASIAVAPIPNRLGQEVRNALIDRLTPRGLPDAPDYELRLSLSDDTEGYGFEPDREVTRERVRMVADYILVDLASGDPALTGQARAIVAYDIVQSDFAALSTREDARREAAQTLVADILARLAVAELGQPRS